MDSFLRKRLASQISQGQVVLFTGAGFSMAANSSLGRRIPSVNILREILWAIAFPSQPLDETSKLGDIYDVASKRAGRQVGETLKTYFEVSTKDLPDVYRVWFSMPWYRMYTLNVDNLDEAVQVAFDLPRRIRSLSALTEGLPPALDAALSIHLNGRVADYPQVTFSPVQYGERTARPDPWYHHLVADLSAHPVVFVGTDLDEAPLWQHIELRRSRERGMRELRPGSYLITPKISTARRVMLKDFNIDLVEMTQEEFASEILQNLEFERQKGFKSLADRASYPVKGNNLQRVADLRNVKGSNNGEYLLGREPVWSDILQGIAVKRRFEDGLKAQIDETGARIVLLTGTAGSGKSTTLMRLALAYQAEGKDVYWLNSHQDIIFRLTREAIKDAHAEVVVIDDIDNFGFNTAGFVNQIIADNADIIVLGALRSTRYERLEIGIHLRKDVDPIVFGIPHLEDSDIDLLLDSLDRVHRLGYLKGLTRSQQVEAFRDKAGRQLLVAMIEATSNQRFDEKIASECKELVEQRELGVIYGTVALATHLRNFLTRDEILLAIGDSTNTSINRIESLLNQKLFIAFDGNHILLRHRVIADKVVDFYRSESILREPIEGLLFMLATKAHPDMPKHSREAKFLRRLISHELLINLTPDKETPRKAYASVESLLSWNYHYWLQRGSYEVEVGDIDLAENFLNQALSMAPDHYMVQTEWAYMSLKRAAMNASSIEAPARAEQAFAHLEEAIESRGDVDPYPYHVLGSQGLSWVRHAVISREDKAMILSRLQHILREGMKRHPLQKELVQLESDIQREYLMTFTVQQ